MKIRTLKKRNPILIGLTVALLASTSSGAFARLLDGGYAEVGPGDLVDFWTLERGATLVVNGGETSYINSYDSTLTLNNATVTSNNTAGAVVLISSMSTIVGSTIINTGTGRGLKLGVTDGDPTSLGSVVTVINSYVEGAGVGASVSGGGDLTLSGTTVIGNAGSGSGSTNEGTGLGVYNSQVNIDQRSQIRGDAYGIGIGADASAHPDIDSVVVIDDSSVEGGTESAIIVETFSTQYPTNADITVQNGATLKGGNGNILEVRSNGIVGSNADFKVDNSNLVGDIFVDDLSSADVTLRNN